MGDFNNTEKQKLKEGGLQLNVFDPSGHLSVFNIF